MNYLILFIGNLIVFVSSQWVTEMENSGYYQGDMILDPEQTKAAANGDLTYATTIGRQWPDAIVYYDYKADIEAQAVAKRTIQTAINEYHKKTCIRFKRRTNEQRYIQFYIGPGCSSYVGYYRNGKWPMPVSLARGCWSKGTVVHELGHALGMYHEQSRPDRDNFVTVNWNNIEEANQFNFKKATPNTINSLGTTYDYLSVMHYGENAFGRVVNGRRLITIKTKKTEFQKKIGNRYGLSETDVTQIKKLYKCKGTNPPIRTQPPPTRAPLTGGPVTRKTNPPTGECKDSDRACSGWKSICKTHFHIASRCRKTCGLC